MSVPQPPGVNPTSQKSTTLQPTLTNDFWDNFVFADTNFNVINWLYNNPLEWLKTYSLSENHVIRIENNVPVVDNQAPRNGGILNFDKVMDPLLQFDKVIGNIPILNISLTLNMAIADGLMGVWDIIASIPLSIIRPFEGQHTLSILGVNINYQIPLLGQFLGAIDSMFTFNDTEKMALANFLAFGWYGAAALILLKVSPKAIPIVGNILAIFVKAIQIATGEVSKVI